MRFWLIASWLVTSSCLAKDLGTFGQTFNIQEQSLLEVIQLKLKTLEETGDLKDHQQKIVERVKKSLKNPAAVSGISKTKHPRTFTFDPSLTVSDDLKDHEGKVFQLAGTVINPLHTHFLTKPLLFIDGEDQAQVMWAVQQQEERQKSGKSLPKIILVKGSPFLLMEQYGFTIYFDQQGSLIKKLGINQVPTRVSQTGDLLTVEEVKLDE